MKQEVQQIARKVAETVRQWGFQIEEKSPLCWKTPQGNMAFQVKANGGFVTIVYIHPYGGYLTETFVPLTDNVIPWQEEVEIVLWLAASSFVAHVLRQRLWQHGFSQFRFIPDFEAHDNSWEITIYDMEKRTRLVVERGSLSKSPLKAFKRMLKAIATATL